MKDIANMAGTPLEQIAILLLRLSLVVTFLWFGTLKFFAYEAKGIDPLLTNSPLTRWLSRFGEAGAARVVGGAEIGIGLCLAAGFSWPRGPVALLGAAGSIGTFLVTLSFLLTTPGAFEHRGPPYFLSTTFGTFLIKDLVLLAASFVLLADGLA
ncbi:YkgB family protein [Sphingosinicellaceae bacterium]|nr:YkgB family protein [Sphingosinicellaceae bacterium]